MSVLYIQEQGACLEKRGERIIVEKKNRALLDIPMANVESLAVFGNVQITMQLMQQLLLHGIDVSFFSFNGKYLGHACAESSRNIFIRLFQYDRYQNLESRLELAKCIVWNKIQNQINLIQQFRWTGTEYAWKSDVEQLKRQQRKLKDQETPEKVMGVEGFSSKVYFNAYGKIFCGQYIFDGRNRRPPKDPINVILSLGYTLLTKDVAAALEIESFEMYLGFLHGLRYGRKSLALDIVEEFRQPVVDRLTLRLFNKNMLGKYDFEEEMGEVRLTEEGFQTFIREYERWMTDKGFSDSEIAFRSRIKMQAANLKKAMQTNGKYHPYEWGRKEGQLRVKCEQEPGE